MTWEHDTHEGAVVCDAVCCDARVTHPVSVGCDGVSACTYAADKALARGWYVDTSFEDIDRCPTHRGTR